MLSSIPGPVIGSQDLFYNYRTEDTGPGKLVAHQGSQLQRSLAKTATRAV